MGDKSSASTIAAVIAAEVATIENPALRTHGRNGKTNLFASAAIACTELIARTVRKAVLCWKAEMLPFGMPFAFRTRLRPT